MFERRYTFLVEYTWPEITESGIGKSYEDIGGDFIHNIYSTGEWGYAYMNLDGIYDGRGKPTIRSFRSQGTPMTRKEAYDRIIRDITAFNESTGEPEKHTVMNGHYPWQHYSASVGFSAIGVETGEGIAASQFRIAMTRGAAKQYGSKPWFVDFSQWFGGYLLDYRDVSEDHVPQGAYLENSSKTGGHHISMEERTLMLAFMAGTWATIVEGGQYMCFYEDKKTLTPLGELCRKMNRFTEEYQPKIGTPYVPFAVILDRYHGLGLCGKGKIFDFFDREVPDDFTYDLLNKYLYKKSLDGTRSADDSNQLANGKYGDFFDFFLPDVSPELIADYKTLIFTGDPDLSAEETEKYRNYVKNGGILVLNTAFSGKFRTADLPLPEKLNGEAFSVIGYGSGSFLVFGEGGRSDRVRYNDGTEEELAAGNWLTGGFGAILDELHGRFVPFEFDHECGYAMTTNGDTVYLMVYNNDGITKSVNMAAEIDPACGFELGIRRTDKAPVLSVKDVYGRKEVNRDGEKFSVFLAPGETAILEIVTGKTE